MRIDGRDHHGAGPFGEEGLDLLVHPAGVVVGERYPEREAPVRGRQGQPSADALHELALVVLREDQQPLQAGRRSAGLPIRIERRQDQLGVVRPGGSLAPAS